MKISVVTTLYQSESFIVEFYQRTKAALDELGAAGEIVFVNDGSPDGSLTVALDLCRTDASVKVIDLSRNFGHHPAIATGLREATGDYVFLLDCDLEEAPENLVPFYQDITATAGVDMVYGVSRHHDEPVIRRTLSAAYYALYNLLSQDRLERDLCMSRLMTRRFVDALLETWTWNVPLAAVNASLGFVQRQHEIQRTFKGWSSYSFTRRLRILIDSITSFSIRPLFYVFLAGFLVFCLSLVMSAYAIAAYLRAREGVAGWYSAFVSLWFIGGLTMMSIGILGIYIGRIFDQVKGRPVAVVRRLYEHEELRDAASAVSSVGAHD